MTAAAQRRKPSRPPRAGRTHYVTYDGRQMLLVEVAAKVGMHRKTLVSRLARNGGDLKKALAEPMKKRGSTAEVADRRAELYKIAKEQHPITVRGVYYQAEVFFPHYIAKTQSGYKMVAADLVLLRKSGKLDYDWIVDNTRNAIRPHAYDNIKHALLQTAANYRADLWKDKDCLVQIWLEKDALSGVIDSVTLNYGVPLMVARGYSSLSFLHEQAAELKYEDRHNKRPVYIYLLGDHDPSGVNAHESIEATLKDMAPDIDFHFERLAVTPKQIDKWHLPTRVTKDTDSRADAWGNQPSVELDAIEPKKLRKLVEDAINKHMTAAERDTLLEDDQDARDYIRNLAESAP
jgi:hypothetical protein